MTIIFYCDEYPPVLNGGIGSVTKVVAEALVCRGHCVVVAGNYSRVKGDFPEYSLINGVHVHRFRKENYKGVKLHLYKLLHRLSGKFSFQIARQKYFDTERMLEKLVRKYKADVIELPDYQDELPASLIKPIKYRKPFSVPMVIRLHGTWSALLHYMKREIPACVLENDKRHIARADYICGVSYDSIEYVKRFLLPDRKFDMVYNPIENNLFSNIQTSDYPEAKTILFFGKIDKRKGAYSLARAFNLVAEKVPYAELVYVGYGEQEQVMNDVNPECRNRVVFKGFMSRQELMTEIDNAFICVLPSYFETFAMAAMEVAARGRALLFSEINTGKELIDDGKTGWLIHPDNTEHIADTIIYAFEHPKETALIARAGYEKCKSEFSTEIIIPQLEEYYQNIIDKQPK
jgi:glycosyltransferase involved in cell wall biosynthesis